MELFIMPEKNYNHHDLDFTILTGMWSYTIILHLLNVMV